jgi:hypothetical protein
MEDSFDRTVLDSTEARDEIRQHLQMVRNKVAAWACLHVKASAPFDGCSRMLFAQHLVM